MNNLNAHFSLPEVYGESLSYYEVLKKLTDKVNELIKNYGTVPELIRAIEEMLSKNLNSVIKTIATDNRESNTAVKLYKQHDLLYAVFGEELKLYEVLTDFTEENTVLVVGENIREVNISELHAEIRKLINDNQAAIRALQHVVTSHSEELSSMQRAIGAIENHNEQSDLKINSLTSGLSSVENKNTEQDREIASIKLKNETQDNEIKGIKEKNVIQDTHIESIEETNLNQEKEIVAIKSKNETQDNEINGVKNEINNLGYVTPEMKGAYGDGVHDDSNALQLAIETKKAVLTPGKTYKITQPLTIANGIFIEGRNATIKGVGCNVILDNTTSEKLCFRNINFETDQTNAVEIYCSESTFENCKFTGNLYFAQGAETPIERTKNTITNCRFTNGAIVTQTGGLVTDGIISNCIFNNTDHSIVIEDALRWSISNCKVYGTTDKCAIVLRNANFTTLDGIYTPSITTPDFPPEEGMPQDPEEQMKYIYNYPRGALSVRSDGIVNIQNSNFSESYLDIKSTIEGTVSNNMAIFISNCTYNGPTDPMSMSFEVENKIHEINIRGLYNSGPGAYYLKTSGYVFEYNVSVNPTEGNIDYRVLPDGVAFIGISTKYRPGEQPNYVKSYAIPIMNTYVNNVKTVVAEIPSNEYGLTLLTKTLEDGRVACGFKINNGYIGHGYILGSNYPSLENYK